MKKLILFLLTAILLILPLSGCFADNQQNEGTTPANTTENTTPNETTPEAEATTPEETTPDATTPPEDNQENPPTGEGELDKSSDLIVTLVTYLEQYGAQYYLDPVSLTSKINGIKNGAQPLHTVFDPNNYYFVCGYYNVTHEYNEDLYCCASEYTWIEYGDETEIQEYYNGMKWAVVFQINSALIVSDILSNTVDIPNIEHFQIYNPTFENGINIASPFVFDETFIYLNNFIYCYPIFDFTGNTIYHCDTIFYHSLITLPCVCFDGEYYLSFYLTTLKSGESLSIEEILSQEGVVSRFGDYYDAIVGVIDVEKYRVTTISGITDYYGVVSIEDFVNNIVK